MVSDRIPLRVISGAPQAAHRVVTEIYKPFFLAGILTVLTAGCTLGALALFGIAQRGSFTASEWTPYVWAHANSQLYGWVGFFVVGFSLQQHAPRSDRSALFHRLAYICLALLTTGILLRFLAEPLVRVDRAPWMAVGVLSGLLQAAAIVVVGLGIAMTRYSKSEGLPWQSKFVFASLFWWMLVALAEPWVFAASHQLDRQASLDFVARTFPALRDAQFLGFVTLMIFGVGFSKFSHCFGAREPRRGLAEIGLWSFMIGVATRSAGSLLAGETEAARFLSTFGTLMLFASVAMLVVAIRVFEPLEGPHRSHKFMRAAFFWLVVAMTMAVLEPAHLRLAGVDFSHAYAGAIRHAVTVGFISQMILAVSIHVVARMNDIVDDQKRTSLLLAFILLNLGNSGRVFLEVATDYSPRAFGPMGFTGFIELIALGIWAWEIASMMRTKSLTQQPA